MSGQHDSETPHEEHTDLTAPEAAAEATRQIAALTGRTPIGAVSVAPSDDGWSVDVEVVEDHRIPSSSDVMAVYTVVLDLDGMLLSYRRVQQYTRGRSGRGEQ